MKAAANPKNPLGWLLVLTMPGVMGGETGQLPTLFLPNLRKEAMGQGSLWIQCWIGDLVSGLC